MAVGVINDALKGTYGNDAVRYSLLSAAVTTTLGALLFVWAARKDGEEDRALQARLGIRRKTRMGR